MPSFIGVPTTPTFSDNSVVRRRTEMIAFTWDEAVHEVVELVRFWEEKSPPRFRRSGRSNRWHISPFGREYYRVRTAEGRFFDLYFDRSIRRGEVSGRWVLWRELAPEDLDKPYFS